MRPRAPSASVFPRLSSNGGFRDCTSRAAVADAKEIAVPAIAADGERTAMAKELGSRVARRGWTAPDNFDEMIAIYADQGPPPPRPRKCGEPTTAKNLQI